MRFGQLDKRELYGHDSKEKKRFGTCYVSVAILLPEGWCSTAEIDA
jgi:hypothetical protein